jgi:tetratricopeptide (TPR) repeat protein
VSRTAIAALGLLVLLAPGCRRSGDATKGPDRSSAALALVDQGRYDEAIASVGDGEDPESLYVLGRAWAGKAATAPLPTPVPGEAAPAEGLFKADELTALGFLERAIAARPDHARAQLALAELLAPHALQRAAAEARAGKALPPPPGPGPDASVERVLRAFGDAVQADPSDTTAAEALVRFATSAGRLAEADGAFQELLRRRREDPALMVRYGDFLAGPRASPEAALAQYQQALIWHPDDAATRTKVAGIQVAAAEAHLAEREYLTAEARLKDARRYGADTVPALIPRVRELEQRLREVRSR